MDSATIANASSEINNKSALEKAYPLGSTLQETLLEVDQQLRKQPENPKALLSKANILSLSGDHHSAIEYYNKSLEFDDKNEACHYNKGVSLQKLGLTTDAIVSYKSAIAHNSKYIKAYLNLSLALHQAGDHAEALSNLNTILTLDPINADALNCKAQILNSLNKKDEAEIEYLKVLCHNPNHETTLENLSALYMDLRKYQKACNIFKQLITLNSGNHEYWCGLGASLQGLGLYEDGISAIHNCLKIKSDFPDAHYNLALIYHELGEQNKAERFYKTAINFNPTHKESHNNLAYIYLEKFDFNAGWLEYEWRWKSSGFDSLPLSTSKPKWHGQKLSNRLLIWSEQGIGDQILHGSILKLLEHYPQEIIVSIDAKLIPIFSRSFKKFTFIDKQLPLPESEYDEQIPIGSLAKIYIESISSLSLRKSPFLLGNSSLTSAVLSHLAEPGKILCGLSWKSSNKNIGDSKSLSLKELKPILLNPKLKFINLQYGQTSDEIKLIYDEFGVEIHTIVGLDLYDDIDGLTSVISACDLVISSSNSTAHLSGALNKNTYLLTPKTKGKLWYWHDINGISPWYPSVQIFPQEDDGVWTHSVEKINSTLEKFFEK